MRVVLVRHASAGHRTRWDGDDRIRPLDERGWEQAAELVEQLAGERFERILSSPYARCVQTFEPLAAARGLPLEEIDALAEGAGAEAALELFRSAGVDLVACVHGDLLEELVGKRTKKGSITPLEL
jgi:broad specificity phosphatase PhoE